MTQRTRWRLSGFGDEIDADPDVQVAVLQALGASAIEVRSAWGVNVVDLGEEQLAGLRRILAAREQSVSAIASPIGKVDVALPAEHELGRLRRAIAAAHKLGAGYIRIFSFYRKEDQSPESIRDDVLKRMRALADLAERENVTLLHENERHIYGDVPARILDLVESVGSDRLRLAWDNANFVQCGVAPHTEGWHLLAPYVDYLQVKDALAATHAVVPAGEGDGEVLETLTALRDSGYRGFASLEPHLTDVHNLGGFSGPAEFGRAARAFRALTAQIGVTLR
ncbi:sugar phosphate isomerase/epimerase [Amycolatopsis acidicola]|uniref:Sugar phosphate isomerase/epimerase n=1 Tax=Amycolatopsis acidicola TaxID=2596893 RepID=A0A5N0VK42_9PSEU|nr:sugar phosphate isomerase/epimerase family protein [Amycolatopsis acidicola]KAA9166536.1 sugar phosphate isomerase/epimerase [Amycolatopsis acidicola]